MLDLTFKELRNANLKRSKEWDPENKITLDFAMMELAGEVGEACNDAKKLSRLSMGLKGGCDTTEHIKTELADIMICLDLIAMRLDIDLAKETKDKFNETSKKYNLSTTI